MRVSDFKFAEYFIKTVLGHKGVRFVDTDVCFVSSEDQVPEPHQVVVFMPRHLGDTLYQIVEFYLRHAAFYTGDDPKISDDEMDVHLKMAMSQIRAMIYTDHSLPEPDSNKPVIGTLRQYQFVWLVLRDLVCPIYQCPLRDMDVVRAKSPNLDVCKLVSAEEFKCENANHPFIFVNTQVESNAFRTAFLLREAVKAHCEEYDVDADYVIRQLLTDDNSKDLVRGFVKMAFVKENAVKDFMESLCDICGIKESEVGGGSNWYKEANTNNTPLVENNFWMMGNYEQMLESTHGPRTDDVARSMEPFIRDLWDRVAKEKKARGKEDMSFEDLLRVQSREFKVEKGLTLNELLADQRIW